MSLVRDRYWIDPTGLDAERAAHRASVFRAVVRQVAGVDGRATVAALRELVRAERDDCDDGAERLDDATDLLASDLPGKFTVVSESWQGIARRDFHVQAAYVHEDTVCLLYAGHELDDPAGEAQVDSMWIGMAEFRALADVALAARGVA